MVATLVRSRALGLVLLATAGANLAAAVLHLPHFRCQLRALTGLPCPGCGVSRGIVRLAQGNVAGMFAANPFVPYFVFLGALVIAAAMLPRRHREGLAETLARFERRVPLHALILLAFAAHGIVRLLMSALRG